MKTPGIILFLLTTIACMHVQAGSGVLGLKAEGLRGLTLDSIPPWPAEMVLKGTNKHAMKVLHKGEVVATVYAAEPAVINITEPYSYDEFVLVLEGEVTLTPTGGEGQTYQVGDSFLVPKGWTGTWDMPFKFRELIIVETRAWEATEE